MSSLFLDNYKTNCLQKVVFPFFAIYSVRHMEKALESKTWLGRSVHVCIATIEFIPFFGALFALVERCLAWHSQHQQSIEIKKIDPIKEKKVEILTEVKEATHNILSTPVEEKKVEILTEVKEATRNILSTPVEEKKVEILTEVKEATHNILSTPGFITDKDDELFYKGFGSRGEIQGCQVSRFTAAQATKYFPQALSPEALKEQRELNLEQYLTLIFKRFGHSFNLEGVIELPSGKKIHLEGFCEAFTVPMLAASFERYAKTQNFWSVEDYQWIVWNFNQMTSSDFTEMDEIFALSRLLQKENFRGPIAFGSGFNWHSTATIFFDQYLIYINRKERMRGISIYHIPDRSLLTVPLIWKMTKRQQVKREDEFNTKCIEKCLKGKIVGYKKLPMQTVGNCTFISMETALYVFMALKHLLNSFTEERNLPDLNNTETWEKLFETLEPEYIKWWNADRQYVFESMVNEIFEWKDEKNAFHQHNLQKSYEDLSKAWNNKYKGKNFYFSTGIYGSFPII